MVRQLFLFILLVVFIPDLAAQEPVPVGKGSYASFPPPGLVVDRKRNVDLVEDTEKRKLYLVKDDGRPIPSNKWYQNLLLQQYGTGLWAMPHKVNATTEGIEIFYPTKPNGDGTHFVAEFPLVVTAKDFKPTDSRAKHWADWLVSFRMPETDTRFMDVTLGEGLPYVWMEFSGIQPTIAMGGHGGRGSRGKNPASYFDLKGQETSFPFTGDTLGITYEGRAYGAFAPAGTKFTREGNGLSLSFAGQAAFLVVCPLPSAKDITLFHQHAYAVPRDTKLSWNYDRNAGKLSTTWKITTELLQGKERTILHGWLPHHWRESTHDLKFMGIDYPTMRGKLRCAVGEEFTITYPFHGILPNLTAPQYKSGFDGERMKSYLADHFVNTKRKFGSDTYWGGKDLQRYAHAAFIAQQTKDPSFAAIAGELRSALANWFTYTPREKERFFAYYPRRKGLVGFNVSYGSQHFTDHHFHYGYFVFSAGLLSQMQPDFAKEYGDIARLIAKTYANYDRSDTRFPFLRTFDIWRGHSFADGNGFPDGNNQESTGEAVNSWAGMILLGEALGDPALTAAGVMGYTMETRANLEYWFDPHGDVFPPAYQHRACGMIWCNSIVWGTWFTASPAWIYGIQWIPSGPYYAYYDRDPRFIKKTYADVVKELNAFEDREAAKKPGHVKKPVTIKELGGELASLHLGFLMHADSNWVVEQIDKLWNEPGDKVAHDTWMASIYYQAHALRELGRVDWACHGNSPTSMVYVNEAKKTRALLAWNPMARAQKVQFFAKDQPIGTLEVPPNNIAGKVISLENVR